MISEIITAASILSKQLNTPTRMTETGSRRHYRSRSPGARSSWRSRSPARQGKRDQDRRPSPSPTRRRSPGADRGRQRESAPKKIEIKLASKVAEGDYMDEITSSTVESSRRESLSENKGEDYHETKTESLSAGLQDHPTEELDMAAMMGFSSFGSTKQKKVGPDVGAVAKKKQANFRQYMNRKNGFNRSLSPP